LKEPSVDAVRLYECPAADCSTPQDRRRRMLDSPGCVMYADDLVLLSASLTSLQTMIALCDSEAQYLDMKFNVAKSAVLRVGFCFKHVCACMSLYGANLQYLDEVRYLGVFLTTGRRLQLSFSEPINKFYKSVNGILYRSKGHMDEMVLLKLFDSYCKPLLCYALDAVSFTDSKCTRLANAWNNIYRKLFKVSDKRC